MAPLPSILSLPELRLAEPWVTVQPGALLRLDPLSILRAIALGAAPPKRRWRDGLPTSRELIERLGRDAGHRLLATPEFEPFAAGKVAQAPPEAVRPGGILDECTGLPEEKPRDSSYLLSLWLRALGTAEAMWMSCQQGQISMEPSRGWVLGLLVDTPSWLGILQGLGAPTPPLLAWDWLRRRCPTDELANHLELATEGPGLHCWPDGDVFGKDSSRRRVSELLEVAIYLAELAGFHHPDGDPGRREILLRGADEPQQELANQLGRRVIDLLEDVGLAEWLERHPPHEDSGAPIGTPGHFSAVGVSSDRSREEVRSHGVPNHGVPNRGRGPSPHGHRASAPDGGPPIDLATAVGVALTEKYEASHAQQLSSVCRAAVDHLGFDRAWVATWVPDEELVVMTTSHQHTRNDHDPLQVSLTKTETQQLIAAQESGRPKCLSLDGDGRRGTPNPSGGLYGALAHDRAVVQVIHTDFHNPLVLVVDNGLSWQPLDRPGAVEGLQALALVAAQVIQNRRLAANYRRARKMATVDALTRLANRWVGIHNLGQEVARSKRTKAPLSVLLIDLDDFKQLNDAHGHLVGDQALRITSRVLRESLRRSDTCCRFGGEEFLVVLPNTTSEDAAVMATRVFIAIETRGEEVELPLTVSIGLASLTSSDDTPEDLLARSDRALYAAKERGRNRFSADAGT